MGVRSFPALLRALGVLVWLGICATTVLQAEWTERLAIWAVASVVVRAGVLAERVPRSRGAGGAPSCRLSPSS